MTKDIRLAASARISQFATDRNTIDLIALAKMLEKLEPTSSEVWGPFVSEERFLTLGKNGTVIINPDNIDLRSAITALGELASSASSTKTRSALSKDILREERQLQKDNKKIKALKDDLTARSDIAVSIDNHDFLKLSENICAEIAKNIKEMEEQRRSVKADEMKALAERDRANKEREKLANTEPTPEEAQSFVARELAKAAKKRQPQPARPKPAEEDLPGSWSSPERSGNYNIGDDGDNSGFDYKRHQPKIDPTR